MVILKPRVWRHRSTGVWLTRCEICSASVKSSSWAWAWKTALGHADDGGHLARAREELVREGVKAKFELRRVFMAALDSGIDVESDEETDEYSECVAAREAFSQTVHALADYLEAVGERARDTALPHALAAVSESAHLLECSGLQEAA